jgi:hypothetical protein
MNRRVFMGILFTLMNHFTQSLLKVTWMQHDTLLPLKEKRKMVSCFVPRLTFLQGSMGPDGNKMFLQPGNNFLRFF